MQTMRTHRQNRKIRWVHNLAVPLTCVCALAFAAVPGTLDKTTEMTGIGAQIGSATAASGEYITWREWIIGSPELAGFALSGSDGLVVGDLDNDGHDDIVSVHESDSEYDSSEFDPDYVPDSEGHVRIAFAGVTPTDWTNITLAEGTDSPAPEDADIADFNGDGFLDVIVAAEL